MANFEEEKKPRLLCWNTYQRLILLQKKKE